MDGVDLSIKMLEGCLVQVKSDRENLLFSDISYWLDGKIKAYQHAIEICKSNRNYNMK
ncbi:MAG: hypothetical protein KGJ13_05095 [Patescibacteria group bacterium]|nr:hypothetical protein [Patescibacteria group bacterium]